MASAIWSRCSASAPNGRATSAPPAGRHSFAMADVRPSASSRSIPWNAPRSCASMWLSRRALDRTFGSIATPTSTSSSESPPTSRCSASRHPARGRQLTSTTPARPDALTLALAAYLGSADHCTGLRDHPGSRHRAPAAETPATVRLGTARRRRVRVVHGRRQPGDPRPVAPAPALRRPIGAGGRRVRSRCRPSVGVQRWGPPAIVTLVAMPPSRRDRRRRGETGAPQPPTEATAPRDAGEPIMAIVSIKTQQVTFYDADGWILRAPVSTGTTGRETPAGVFAVLEKDKTTARPSMTMPDAEHAAHHLERHRAAWRAAARLCGLARLRSDALWLCREAVRQDVDRDAGDHLAR